MLSSADWTIQVSSPPTGIEVVEVVVVEAVVVVVGATVVVVVEAVVVVVIGSVVVVVVGCVVVVVVTLQPGSFRRCPLQGFGLASTGTMQAPMRTANTARKMIRFLLLDIRLLSSVNNIDIDH